MKCLDLRMEVRLPFSPIGLVGQSGLTSVGAYAEYIAVSTKMLVHKPAQLSWEEAAGVPEVIHPFLVPSFPANDEGDRLIYNPDLDHSVAGTLPHRRLPSRTICPLARRRFIRLHLRHPAGQSSRRESDLRNRRLTRKDRLRRERARGDRRIQLQDSGLGGRNPEGDGRGGCESDCRLRWGTLLPGEPGCRSS